MLGWKRWLYKVYQEVWEDDGMKERTNRREREGWWVEFEVVWTEYKQISYVKWKRIICKIDNCIAFVYQSFNVSYYILLFLYLSYYFELKKMLCKIIFCDHILHYRINFAYNAEVYMYIKSIRDVYGGVYGVQSCSIWHRTVGASLMGQFWTAGEWRRITKPLPNY